MSFTDGILGEGTQFSVGEETRRYNLLAGQLIADLIKTSFGPRGFEKIYIDLLGEATLTKNGSTMLRKIDVEHPAAKAMIDASNSVDNEVGDGTISVVILAGSLLEKAGKLLDLGMSPSTIEAGYRKATEYSLDIVKSIAKVSHYSNKEVMLKLAETCLRTKAISVFSENKYVAKLVTDAFCTIADFVNRTVEVDDIKIEEKPGNTSDIQLVRGVVIDKTIDYSGMPRMIENSNILLINVELDDERTKTDAEIVISSPQEMQAYILKESDDIKRKVQKIIDSGANLVVSQKGISRSAQNYLSRAGIISLRRVKENDLHWLEKASGALTVTDLDNISEKHLGFAGKVYEKFVGDDKMVFVEGCKNPKSVTILLRANSKRMLDEYHRTVLDAIIVLKDFFINPSIVVGGGSTEMIIANELRKRSLSIEGKEQIVIQNFAEAFEEIPLTIARNSGMNMVDTIVQLRNKNSEHNNGRIHSWYGVDAIERKVREMYSQDVIEPLAVKEQVIKTASEVASLLIHVDEVIMKQPIMYTHTHGDGKTHSHARGNQPHDHFDKLGKMQRPSHHYY
ncbi:thermosome subunit beta [Candidatus Nitrosotalea okcheonensis]|uniref:Thermosome subunit n=1 Tax=Candidatus Nitrosotalea okcheonensis TaxID=1903276 RepID=A0A2H1FHZ1_9ARCH|nr:thermosome subunit beta [Candidatus Nitrosotalea okcheonensis]SMH72386.1 Thermosome subunit [Candidatus Nitrosotalea okcheonensis]